MSTYNDRATGRNGGYGGDSNVSHPGGRDGYDIPDSYRNQDGDYGSRNQGTSDTYSASAGKGHGSSGGDTSDSYPGDVSDQGYGSGTVGGVGFGNKSSGSSDDPRGTYMSNNGAHGHSEYSHESLGRGYGSSGANDSYGGSTEYGSGATGGVGYGNKTNGASQDSSGLGLRREHVSGSDPYSGSTEYGSGTTGGVGYGNKKSSFESGGGGDSKAGKFMEKVGGMMGNEKMQQQGYEKRVEKGYVRRKILSTPPLPCPYRHSTSPPPYFRNPHELFKLSARLGCAKFESANGPYFTPPIIATCTTLITSPPSIPKHRSRGKVGGEILGGQHQEEVLDSAMINYGEYE
ncbi:MAG: hypothetical protein M1835_001294 [Candelina submexicana]|nr:MAG: hypothetical protein M1835_001294 [Candelina submexicana]